MQKIKILAVAPYEGMAEAISSIAGTFNDIELTVQIGDLDTGRKIAVELAHKNYDVIISRGGTAELIRSTVEIPVIDISISGYDILRAIKLAETYSGRYVIAGFSGITGSARVLCDLLQYDIDILTFTGEEDALPALRDAEKRGCTLTLGDMTAVSAAKKLGMNSILISSGTESIKTAIEEAVKLVRSSLHVHKQKDLFQALLTDQEQEFLIYDPAGSLWFSSLAVDEMNDSLMNLVQTYLKAFLKVPDQTVARQIRDKVYTISSRHLYYSGQKYTAVIIRLTDAIIAEENPEIKIYNKPDYLAEDSPTYYSSSSRTGDTAYMIEEYSRSKLPVLIAGETGTGKDKVASMMYENGPFAHSPFYVIDCKFMGERKWNNLLTSDNSPLSSLHATIYIKNCDTLSKVQLEKLFSYVESTNLIKRNRLIFSLVTRHGEPHDTDCVRTCLENRLSCLTLLLPPLRERLSDFSSIAALYLHKLNVSLGKQIIGFETEAMEVMTSYQWPGNLDQLHRVLKELVTLTSTPYISYRVVKNIIAQEPSFHADSFTTSLDLTQTLDDINYQIIQTVLKEEQGNKEKTSKRLGISRSTLWRLLKSRDSKA